MIMVQNRFIRIFAGICMLALVAQLYGCKHEPPVQPANPAANDNTPTDEGDCDPDVVYFERDVLPILVSNCAMDGCHDAQTAEDGVRLYGYNEVINTADVRPHNLRGSDLYEMITEDDEDKRMPPSPKQRLSQAQINLIAKWINQGAKNLSCTENTCDTTTVTFSGSVQPILQKNCLGCHSGTTPSGNLNFGQVAVVQSVAQNGKLNGVITHTPGFKAMPQGGKKLSDCDIAKIQIWIKGGAQNN
ncbi:MAG: c-type cytochrome [Hymenobacteraceae bacterium]|nr:c-type cytochrome [Hymenobacteraceae bacterium]